MLRFDKLSLEAATKPILEQVSLSISEGESVAIVGESGSGKSTLLKLALGLPLNGLQVTTGQISYKDQVINPSQKRVVYPFVGTEVAWITQQASVSFNNRRKIKHIYKDIVQSHKQAVDELRTLEDCLTMVNLNPEQVKNKYPFELSGGMMQRVAIALSLVTRPALLLADEPTSALDVISKLELIKVFQSLHEQEGMAILFVTHDISVAQALAQRIIVMKTGRLIEEGTTKELLASPKEAYTRQLLQAVPSLATFTGKEQA